MIQANPTHYGDPKTECMRDEGRHWGGGLSGWYCSPVCKWDEDDPSKDIPCPEDKPSGVTARPGCTDMDGDTGSTCQSFPGSDTGECRYVMPYAEPPELALPPVLIGAEMIQPAKVSTYATSMKLALPPATMGAEMIQAGGPSVIV